MSLHPFLLGLSFIFCGVFQLRRQQLIKHILILFFPDLEKCTGPKSRATHWKQTVLYLEDVLTVCQGESIVGSMTVAPNKKNPRDVDIMLKYSVNGQRCRVSRTLCYRMR